jgi:hypothetical protein
MKRSPFVLLVAMVAVGTIGCHEDTTLEPSGTNLSGGLAKAASSENVIILPATLATSAGVLDVVGTVKYAVTQSPILREELYDVSLSTDVLINALGFSRITSTSVDRVNLSGRASTQLEKYYFLRGGPLSTYLYLEFEISARRVTLTNMSIIE